jgi:exodeoxyribonuclease V
VADIVLTPHQQAALDYVVRAIVDGTPLVALRGLAGTGKTSLIPALRRALADHDKGTVVGSPTHRAAMILRKKGILDADTVHAHALMPRFTPDYTRCLEWLGEEVEYHPDTAPHGDVEGLPYLVHAAVTPTLDKGRDLPRRRGRYSAKKLLASLGIHGKNYFAGFTPKAGVGVLIIDEASMVGKALLEMCQQAYRQIILIGDPGQLPPVKDEAVLPTVPGTDLTEIHRQASDSPILQLAYRARQGEPFWRGPLRQFDDRSGDVLSCAGARARDFLDAPLLVWRNVTRLECTHAIREALGFVRQQVAVGEPLVCRATSQEDRADGFYNNGLYRVIEVDPDDNRFLTIEDALGNAMMVYAHMEELDGEGIPPRAVPFRFGYALTAHTAQGGEWPLVYISMADLLKYAAASARARRTDEIAQWAYTAITRAKTTLCFLTRHAFTTDTEESIMAAPKNTIAPPSSPLLGQVEPATPLTLEPDPFEPEPDDIPPVKTPQAVVDAITPTAEWLNHEALLQGFMQHFQGKIEPWLRDTCKEAMSCIEDMQGYTKRLVEVDQEKLRQAETALEQRLGTTAPQERQVRHDPYEIHVEALSPQGYPVSITVRKASAEELLVELPDVLGWLAENHYEAVPRLVER